MMIDVKLFKSKLKKLTPIELGQYQATTMRELMKAHHRASDLIFQTAYANARLDYESCAEYSHKMYLIGIEIEERNKI